MGWCHAATGSSETQHDIAPLRWYVKRYPGRQLPEIRPGTDQLVMVPPYLLEAGDMDFVMVQSHNSEIIQIQRSMMKLLISIKLYSSPLT